MRRVIDSHTHKLPWSLVDGRQWGIGSVFTVVGPSVSHVTRATRLDTTGYVENPWWPDEAIGRKFRLVRTSGYMWFIDPAWPDHIALPDGI